MRAMPSAVSAALLWLTVFWVPAAYATLDQYDFSGAVSEQRYRALIEELRCLVCQNESLAGSQAELAEDLRHEVYDLMAQGRTDQQVIDFLTARYGDFVLYEPPVRPSTYILWVGPFLFLALGGFVLFRSVASRKRQPESELTAEERDRVSRLLNPNSDDTQGS